MDKIKQKSSKINILIILLLFLIILLIFGINILLKKQKNIYKKIEEKENEKILDENQKKENKEKELKKENKEKNIKNNNIFGKTPKKKDLIYSSGFKFYFVNNEIIVKGDKNFDINLFKKEIKKHGAKVVFENEKNKIYIVKFNRILNEKFLMDYIAIFKKINNVSDAILNSFTKEEYEKLK